MNSRLEIFEKEFQEFIEMNIGDPLDNRFHILFEIPPYSLDEPTEDMCGMMNDILEDRWHL